MFWNPGHFNFYLYRHPTDMRKSFDGLCGIISGALQKNPLSGDVYAFVNKRRDRLKLLMWDADGFWIFYKRLEKGTFQISFTDTPTSLTIPYDQLLMILRGIDLDSIRKRKRYTRLNEAS